MCDWLSFVSQGPDKSTIHRQGTIRFSWMNKQWINDQDPKLKMGDFLAF